MSESPDHTPSKVPAVTLGFWIIKVVATTLGETGVFGPGIWWSGFDLKRQ